MTTYAHFRADGSFARTFEHDPATLPPSALITTGPFAGLPRTIELPPMIEHAAATEVAEMRPDGWTVRELSAEEIAARINPAAEWEAFLSGHVEDEVTGIRLKANRQARNDFIGQATLLREAVDAGLVTNASPQSVWDEDGVEHVLTAAEVRALLLRYGIAWQSAFNLLAP